MWGLVLTITFFSISTFSLFSSSLDDIIKEQKKDNDELGRENKEYNFYLEKGKKCIIQHNFNKAINYFTIAIGLKPNDPSAYVLRGVSFKSDGRDDQAFKDCNQAIKLGTRDYLVFVTLGLLNYEKHKYNNAIENFNKAIVFRPEDPFIYYSRGNIYMDIKNYLKAIKDYTKAIELDKSNAEYYYCRSKVYFLLGDCEAALKDINTAIILEPKANNLYYYLRSDIFYWGKGDYNHSIEDLKKAIKYINTFKKNSVKTSYPKKYITNPLKEKNEIIIILVPRITMAGRYDEALAWIKRINPKTYISTLLKSEILLQKGKYKDVIKDMSRLINIGFNKDPFVYFNLGKSYYELGNLTQAEENIKEAINSDTVSEGLIENHFLLLHLYEEKNSKNDAKEIVKLMENQIINNIEEYPNKRWYWKENLTFLYAKSNVDITKALNLGLQVVKHRPCWDSYLNLGLIYLKMENNIMSVRSLEKAQALNPNNAWIWYYLGLARKELNQMKAAKYAWEQGLKINPNHRFIKEELEKIK